MAAAVVLLVGSLGVLFTLFARAMRRDFQERFHRVRERLDQDANRLIRELFGREQN